MDKLTKKRYKSYTYPSRYSNFPYFYQVKDQKYTYGTTDWLKNTNSYSLHTVKKGETLDFLALYYYNNPTLYWIIADYNRINDPFEPLSIGEKLMIPVISNIEYR